MVRTLETKLAGAAHWTTRSMAEVSGLSDSSVLRIWHAFGLQPHRSDIVKLSNDPQLVEKVRDIVGRYLHPPERRWFSASARSHSSTRWIAPSRCGRCGPGSVSGRPMTTVATEPPPCSPPWTSAAAR